MKNLLESIGYSHEGDLRVKERHAFTYPEYGTDNPHLMTHHLYVCPEYSEELKRHIIFRDYLRLHPGDRDWYGSVKTLAAKYYPEDIDAYMTAKHPCVREIFCKCGIVY